MPDIPSPQDILKKLSGSSSAPVDSGLPSPDSILKSVSAGAPSFGANLFNTAKSFVSNAASKIGSFVSEQATNVRDFVTGDLTPTPADVLDGVKKTAAGTWNGAVSISQGFLQGVERIIKSTSEATIGPEATNAIANFGGPISPHHFSQDIAGTSDKVASYQDIFAKAHNYAIDNNATAPEATSFASLAVFGTLFADNPLIGPETAGGKGLFKLSIKGVEDLAKATDEAVIFNTLKREVPHLTDQEAHALTPVFKEATTPAEVQAAADHIAQIQTLPVKAAADTTEIPAPEAVQARVASDEVISPRQAAETPPGALEDVAAGTQAGPGRNTEGFFHEEYTSPKGETLLKMEPLRLDRQDASTLQDVFTGSEKQIQNKIDGKPFRVYRVSPAGKALEPGDFVFDNKQFADDFLKQHGEARGLTEIASADVSKEDLLLPQHYDNGTIQGEFIYSPKISATQSIAKETSFPPQLLQEISKEDMPGPIADTLKREFPNISDAAVATLGNRLKDIKRTSDIEGVLRIIKDVNDKVGQKANLLVRNGKIAAKSAVLKSEESGLPRTLGELLTDGEHATYLDNVSRAIRDKEDAVLAQQEYDALWEHADQRVIDRFEELKIIRDIMRDTLDSSQGKELNALYKGTFLSPHDVGLDELIEQRKGKGIDSRIGEIMMGQEQPGVADTVAQGQKALDDYRSGREDLASIEKELRELRPAARAARILQSMMEDVPVVAKKDAGAISTLASPDHIGKYKDITGFMGQARDLHRNFKAFFGSKYEQAKEVMLDPFDRAKGDLVDTLNKMADDLEEGVVKKFDIKRGSKEDAAIQRYGDTSLPGGQRLSLDGLLAEFGSKRGNDIVAADAWFRKTYNELIDRVNAVRAQIYPNDPKKLIPKRKDYYRHYKELSDGVQGLIDLLEINADSVFPHEISPSLSGISEFTKPSSKWLSFAQERTGKGTDLGAIGGFLNYAPAFAYAVHIDPFIGKFRFLRRELADIAPEAKPLKLNEPRRDTKDLIGNFLVYLDDFANDLAGKTNPMDRYLQKVIPGGRKTFATINWVNSRVKANTILGNLSSSIAQIFNVPNGIASAKLHSIPGIQRSLASIFVDNEPMAASSFIKERYQQSLQSRFKIDWLEHPIKGSTDRGREFAAWITQALDEVGTKFIWNSHYSKGIAENAPDPVKYADDMTREMVAGRGIGEVPLLQKSKITQLVAPFQIEVANAWYVLKDFVDKKQFGSIATLFVANYLFNRAAEHIRGTPVVFDPIQSLIDGATQASDEMKDDGSPSRAAFKFVGRQVGEILSNLPFGQTIASAIPDAWVQKATGSANASTAKKEFFGSADPGRFGGGLLSIKGLEDPLYKLLPPFGGAQVEKTIGGIASMLGGKVSNAGGDLSFRTDPSFLNLISAVAFGKNATPQARKFYDTRDDLFNRIYRQDANRTSTGFEAEKVFQDMKDLAKTDPAAAAKKMQELEQSDPELADAVGKVADDAAAGLDGTDRLVKMLGVMNGERAKYIVEQVNALKTNEEKAKFMQNLDDKKLISDNVFEQIKVLMGK